MKPLRVDITAENGDLFESLPLDGFAIAEGREEAPAGTNQDIIERIRDLYDTVVMLLRERQAVPRHGYTWLKLALGEALLTADEQPDDVVLEVIVRSLVEGEDDGFSDPDES
jgi:hypothetical protein